MLVHFVYVGDTEPVRVNGIVVGIPVFVIVTDCVSDTLVHFV